MATGTTTKSRAAVTRRPSADVPPVATNDAAEAARAAGLRYVSDQGPGIRRRRSGRGFTYTDVDGSRLRDPEKLRRIKALAIPPAWTDVWICPVAHGHIQATGRDARGRKQYRYHPRFREVRDGAKYERTLAFAEALPAIRAQVERDLALPGLSKRKVVAAVVRLLELTQIRVGNEEYARQNRSYGLTTMRDRHVKIQGGRIRFRFKGKSGKEHALQLQDRRLAAIVKRCQELPGQVLFQFRGEDDELDSVDSEDVNSYLREITGQDYTAKDFRTWAGTLLAATALQAVEEFDTETAAKRNVVRAIEDVARQLGNTPAVCRSCYVHPAILESYLEGELVSVLRQRAEQELAETLEHRSPEEAAVLALLQQRLKRASEDVRGAA